MIEKQKIFPSVTYLIGGERTLSDKTWEREQLYNKKNGIISFRNDYKILRNPIEIRDAREMLKLVFSQSLHPKLNLYY